LAYIYKITNNLNNKIYIGKTEYTVEKRFKEHCRDYKKRDFEKRPLYSAMNKYGVENFAVETIEETDNPEEREKYWIEYYGSFKDGYNATIGGDGKRYADYDLIYNLFNKGLNKLEINKITGYDDHTISAALDSYKISHEERVKRGRIAVSKSVAMIVNNTIVKTFSSSMDAALYIKEKDNLSSKPTTISAHIRDVANGNRKSAYKYQWIFI
jgi:group I intron endonuclease